MMANTKKLKITIDEPKFAVITPEAMRKALVLAGKHACNSWICRGSLKSKGAGAK